jgi:hypothetical protein
MAPGVRGGHTLSEHRQTGKTALAHMNHPLQGCDLGTLTRSLMGAGGVPMKAWPTLAAAYGSALGRAPLTGLERLYEPIATKDATVEAPVFILGHWRSGTTHLYNVLSKAERFAYVPPVATGMPWEMLTLGQWLRPLLEKALPEDRRIDRIPVNADSPQEDEFAIASMSTASFYHGIYFPKVFDARLDAGVFLDDAPPHAYRQWQKATQRFYKKLVHTQPGKTLLLKNPVHTARVSALKDLFPDARFVHLRRNPYKVFLSMRNFYTKLFEWLALQDYDHVNIDDAILRTYSRMMQRLEAESANLKKDAWTEIVYEDLDADPLPVLAQLYEDLSLGDFTEDRPLFESYLDSVRGFQKNIFTLDAETADLVERHWGRWIEAWGYERPETPQNRAV